MLLPVAAPAGATRCGGSFPLHPLLARGRIRISGQFLVHVRAACPSRCRQFSLFILMLKCLSVHGKQLHGLAVLSCLLHGCIVRLFEVKQLFIFGGRLVRCRGRHRGTAVCSKTINNSTDTSRLDFNSFIHFINDYLLFLCTQVIPQLKPPRKTFKSGVKC